MITGTWLLLRHRMRRTWTTNLALCATIALGGATALGAANAAVRTERAFDDYRERFAVAHLVVNPSLFTVEIEEVLHTLPGARDAATSTLFAASLGRDDRTLVMGSHDGRWNEIDVPVVHRGRLPTGRDELFVDRDVARDRRLSVGDVVTVTFVDPIHEVTGAKPTTVGVESLRVVGVGTLAGEVLPEPLYPRGSAVVSPDVAARYDCAAAVAADDASFATALPALFPAGCSAQYHWVSLRLERGDLGVRDALDAFSDAIGPMNAALPDFTDDPEYPLDDNIGYAPITTVTGDEAARVERANRPSVVALAALSLAASGATVALCALIAARATRQRPEDLAQLRALGLDRAARARLVAAPPLASVVAGVAVAAVVAWVTSPSAPVGLVRVVNPTPTRTLAGPTIALAMVVGVTMIVVVLGLARRAARVEVAAVGPRADSHRPGAMIALLRSTPVGRVGMAVTFGGPGGVRTLVGIGAVGGGLAVAALVFGANLDRLAADPSRYGWTWDVAVLANYGYGSIDTAAMARALDHDPDVVSWSSLAFVAPISVDGRTAAGLVGRHGFEPTVVAGRAPEAADEVALGTITARNAGFGIGDRVTVGSPMTGPTRAVITGLVTLPALGPYQSDRTGPGEGVMLPSSAIDDEVAASATTFFGIDLRSGADRTEVARQLRGVATDATAGGFEASAYTGPVAPPEVIDVRQVRRVPSLVALVLSFATIVAVSASLDLAARASRLDLAVLRALGMTPGQARRTLYLRAAAAVLVAAAAAIPVGVVGGRLAWRAFAAQLGVAPDAVIPASIAPAVLAAVPLLALATGVSAFRATRDVPAARLRAR